MDARWGFYIASTNSPGAEDFVLISAKLINSNGRIAEKKRESNFYAREKNQSLKIYLLLTNGMVL